MALPLLLLTRCTAVTVKDAELCGSLASKGASCFYMLSDGSRDLSLAQFAEYWNDLSDPKICTTASAFASFKAEIEQLCSDHQGACSYEVEQKVDAITAKFNGVVSKANKWKAKRSSK
jgi:hypothetical protein